MKRLMVVATMVVAAIASSGCNRGWSCWMNRGEECSTCSTAPAMDMESGLGEYMVPPPPAKLPEPIN